MNETRFIADAGSVDATSRSRRIAADAGVDHESMRGARLPAAAEGPPAGELAIQWADSGAETVSARLLAQRDLLAASGLLDRSEIPGDPSYNGSIAYATPLELRQRFETEVRDQRWARAAERQAEQFLDSHPFRRVYGSLALECKATLCRFAAVADGATMIGSGRASDWQQLMHELESDPVSRGLWSYHRTTALTNNEHPGQVGYVTWLRRRQPPGN